MSALEMVLKTGWKITSALNLPSKLLCKNYFKEYLVKDHNRLNAGIPQQVNQIYMIINESNPEGKNLDQISSFLINKIKDVVLQVVPYISTNFL